MYSTAPCACTVIDSLAAGHSQYGHLLQYRAVQHTLLTCSSCTNAFKQLKAATLLQTLHEAASARAPVTQQVSYTDEGIPSSVGVGMQSASSHTRVQDSWIAAMCLVRNDRGCPHSTGAATRVQASHGRQQFYHQWCQAVQLCNPHASSGQHPPLSPPLSALGQVSSRSHLMSHTYPGCCSALLLSQHSAQQQACPRRHSAQTNTHVYKVKQVGSTGTTE